MSGITLALVETWRPELLGTAAGDVRRVSSHLDSEVAAVTSKFRRVSESWRGPAADAAAERVAREVRTGRDLVDALETAHKALDNGSIDLGAAKSHLLSLVATARGNGFLVSGDGTVTPPTAPPVPVSPGQGPVPGRDSSNQLALNQQARDIAGDITRALQGVADADSQAAAALTSIEVPVALESEVNAFLERLRTSDDLMTSALGRYGAGGAALAQTLQKGFGLFGKTGAYSRWLSMTGRQLKNAGGAFRFMTGHSSDPAAYQAFVRAMGGADDAKAVFQTGKANGGVLRLLMGSKAARLVGRAFLPITLATGVMDTLTGGGYEGARGWATRVSDSLGRLGQER